MTTGEGYVPQIIRRGQNADVNQGFRRKQMYGAHGGKQMYGAHGGKQMYGAHSKHRSDSKQMYGAHQGQQQQQLLVDDSQQQAFMEPPIQL